MSKKPFVMEKSLREHAAQINDAVTALIEMEAMKAENMARIQNGEALAYNENDFIQLLSTYELGFNSNILKKRRFL